MGPLTDEVVIVETSTWIDYLNDAQTAQCEWLNAAIDCRRLGITDLSLCEVLQGIPREGEFQRVRQQLVQFEVCKTGGEDIAVAAARNYRRLRSKGVTIRTTIDCIIATYCIERGYFLLHNDRDFDPFEQHLGLRVVDTTERTPPLQ